MEAVDQLRAALLQLIQTAHAAAGRPPIRELERETGVSNSVISRALTGQRVPSRPAFLALAEALGADPAEWGLLWDAHDAASVGGRERAELLAALTPPSDSLAPRGQIATCAVEGCERAYYSRGLCSIHYQRWWRMTAPERGR